MEKSFKISISLFAPLFLEGKVWDFLLVEINVANRKIKK